MAMIIKNLSKKYGDKVVYDNFNLEVADNEITAVLGESGSGKTTLINILCGLTSYEGEISGNHTSISTVFQKDRLVPNLTVKGNIELVEADADIDGLLSEFGLDGLENAYIKSLSGGMARRVAIMRALAKKSDLLLLDEPFINLDLALKYRIMDIILERQKKDTRTTIFVTHDIGEAVYMADRIVVLDKAKIIYDKNIKGFDNEQKEKAEKQLFNLMMNIKNY